MCTGLKSRDFFQLHADRRSHTIPLRITIRRSRVTATSLVYRMSSRRCMSKHFYFFRSKTRVLNLVAKFICFTEVQWNYTKLKITITLLRAAACQSYWSRKLFSEQFILQSGWLFILGFEAKTLLSKDLKQYCSYLKRVLLHCWPGDSGHKKRRQTDC